MKMDFTEGLALILEGTTEKVFYKNLLIYLQSLDSKIVMQKEMERDSGDMIYIWIKGKRKVIVKTYVVGTITQIIHSGKWFANRCANKYKLPWTVCLCYDADSSSGDISKFHEGDWERLRNELEKSKAKEIIDLAASADIEDVLLYDIEGICSYLQIKVPEYLPGRKGKAKMKALYRSCGATYHEGERAEQMIKVLDMDKIIRRSPLGLQRIVDYLI